MSAKRILIIGSNGLLGQKLTDVFARGSAYRVTLASQSPQPVRATPSAQYMQVEITSKKDVKRVVFACEPDVIVNAAAITNVDACEKERELAWKVNVGGVENIIEAARKNESKIVHLSSDYIFDGKSGPYNEDDRPEPLNYYGKTKLASENALRVSGLSYLIARTIVLYGYAQGVKPNFALWLVQNLEKKTPVRVVDDQEGNPTLADDLAYGIVRGVELGRSGVYHIAGRDIVSRYDFAVQLAHIFEFDQDLITPVKTAQLKQPALRPLLSGLITLRAEIELGIRPSTVEQGLFMLKGQLSRTMRKMSDSAPIPGQSSGTHRRG